MSATWVDAESPQEQETAPEMMAAAVAFEAKEIFDGLEDRDNVFGEKGKEDVFARAEKMQDGSLRASTEASAKEVDRDVFKSERDVEHNFITNGSFEKYSGDALKSGEWRAFKQLDGWNLDEGPQFEVVEADHGKVGATDGKHWLDTDASPGNIAFSQKVDGLTDSESYKLSFDTMSRGGEGSGTLVAYWNGEKVGVIEGAGSEGWKTNTFEVTAGSGDGSNTLRFADFGRVDNAGTALDNVRLVANVDQEYNDRSETREAEAVSHEAEQKAKLAGQNEKLSSAVALPFEKIEAEREEIDREIGHNFINNGSFEKYSGSQLGSGEWRGLKQLDGWNLDGGPQFEVVNADHGKVGATDGNTWLDTDASPGNISFSQKVEGLTNSETYKLSFDTRSRGAEGTGVLVAYWNGEKIGVAEGNFNDGWKTNSFEVKAGSGDGSNTLRFAELGRVDNAGTALDNVRLVAVNNVEAIDHADDRSESAPTRFGTSDEERFLQKSIEQVRFAIGESSIVAGEKLEIHADLPDGVDRGAIQVHISGIPAGAQLSAGTEIGQGEWRLSGDDLKGLTLATNSVFGGNFDIKVEASIKSPTPLYSESFEKGADGWSKPSIEGTKELTNMLGRFGGTGGEQAIFKSFKAPEGVSSVVVEFDFLELDSWDGEKFQVFANDKLVSQQSFFTHWPAYAADGDKADSVAMDAGTKNQAFSGWADQRHRYTIQVPVENGVFKIGFGSTLDQSIDDESFAIDNLVISTSHSVETSLELSVKHSVALVPAVDGDFADGPVTVKIDVQASLSGTLGTVQIDNVPSTVTLSSGTKLSDGSWLLTADEATKFQLIGEYEGAAELKVRSSFTTDVTLYQESFEKGAAGWSNNSVTNGGGSLGSFLGRFSEMGSSKGNEQTVFKTFNAPEGVTSVMVEFDFLELDSWDGEKFQIFGNDKLVSSQSFFTHWPAYAPDGDKADSVALDSGKENQGFSGWADQRHRYTIEIPVENGQFKIGFGSTLDQSVGDESWGIDNLKVVASQTVEATTSISINGRVVPVIAENDPLIDPTPIVVIDNPVDPTPVVVIDDLVDPTPVVVIDDLVDPTPVVVIDDLVDPTPVVVIDDLVDPTPVVVIDDLVDSATVVRNGNSANPTDRTQLGLGGDEKYVPSNLKDVIESGDETNEAIVSRSNELVGEDGNSESIRTNSEISRTTGEIVSLLSEFDRVLDQTISAEDYDSVDQTYTLKPADQIDWNDIEFADLVESNFGRRSLTGEDVSDSAAIDASVLATEAERLIKEQTTTLTEQDETSTLSRLWSLVRAYGGVRTKG